MGWKCILISLSLLISLRLLDCLIHRVHPPSISTHLQSAGVRGAVICTTLLNRLEGDQVTMTPQDYENWMKNVITLTLRLIGKTLDLSYDK